MIILCVHMVSHTLATMVLRVCSWTFSDIFEEGGQKPKEFAQAFGTRSFNGTPNVPVRVFLAGIIC